MTVPPLWAALASILMSVLGQIALKIGTGRALSASGPSDAVPFGRVLAGSLLEPAVLLGLALYAAGALVWIYVLARWDVSKAYPLLGFGFVLTLAAGALFLGEKVGLERMLGCALICAGLVFVARS